MPRLHVEIEVTFPDDEELISHTEDGIYCSLTGDSYSSLGAFVDHQIGRDLQVLKLEEVLSVRVIESK